MDWSTQIRVIIRARVTDIPGDPLKRYKTLGDIFCDQVLHRPLNAQPHPSGYDGLVILDGFDSKSPVKKWFIYDLNVKSAISQKELLTDIPHKVFLASRESGVWTFIPRDRWSEQAKSWCKTYVWGGRMEQELVAAMRENEKKAATNSDNTYTVQEPH